MGLLSVKGKPSGFILKWSIIGMGLFAASVLARAHALETSSSVSTVKQVDLNRYAGQWYEIAHLPMYFQRKCASDTTAHYSLKPNGKVRVLNQCRKQNGEVIASEGEATTANAANSKLKVSFLPDGLKWLPFTKGDYWVLKLDDNYQTVLVGGPTHKYLWVLSRTPQLDKQVLDDYLQAASAQGYDTSKLIYTPHKQAITAK
jgi:apolipoprotein D and lipocalin family protein